MPALQVGPELTGVGMYTLELIRGLSRLSLDGLELVIGAPYPDLLGFAAKTEGMRVVPLPLRRDDPWGRMLATHTSVPAHARAERAQILFAPNFIAPLQGRFETAVMVHDLTFERFPHTTPRAKRLYYRLLVRRSVLRARRIFVSTRAVGLELAEFAPSVADRIRHTPEGVSPAYLVNGDDGSEAARGLSRPPRRDFLFVGTLEPRKNLVRILAAHGNQCRNDPRFPALRLVGGKGWEDRAIHRALHDHPDPSRLHRLGYRSADALRAEYDSALALVFPSMYEGFGLPILEAMTRGCPVLTSRGIATQEVAGDAALLVDPMEIDEIERGLARLAMDAALRQRLTRAGRERAARFSWDRCARATLEGLREIATASGTAYGEARR